MTSEEALHATEMQDYYTVEPLKPAAAAALASPPAGYDSATQPLLSVEEIKEMLIKHQLVEVFLEALPEQPKA